MAPLDAGEPRLLPVCHPPEERLLRLVKPGQDLLQHLAVEGRVLRELRADGLAFCFLLLTCGRDVAPMPGGDALLQGHSVERAPAPQHALKLPLLGTRRAQLLLVGLATRGLFAPT
jgi:hypothetical protein